MPRKVFVAQTIEATDDPPVIVIEGKVRKVGEDGVEFYEDFVEEFEALTVVPAGILADFVASIATNDRGQPVWPADAIMDYLRAVIVERDKARFEEFARDTTKAVTTQMLHDAVMWLAPLQAGNPTTQSST